MQGVTGRFGLLFRALRVLRRIALWGALALFALLLAVFAINAFDERPSPQTLALLQPTENRYRPDENIYVALAGFDAPPGQSVFTAGEAKIAHYNQRVDLMLQDPLLGLEAPTAPDPAGLKFTGSLDCCRPREVSFWGNVSANAPKIEQLVDDNRELYQRYLALFGLPGYYETARASLVTPFYLPPTPVRNLFLAKLSLQMQTGDATQMRAALNSLRLDAELWRRVLTGEGALTSKLVAVAYLQIDSLVLSDLIADPQTAIPQDMEEFLPEFALSTWNIGNAFAAEFRANTFVYRQVQALSDRHWQPPDSTRASRVWNRILTPIQVEFFKINATENAGAKVMNALAGLAALDPSTFSTSRARLEMWGQENADLFSVRTVYNPVGKILLAIAAPVYPNYVLRPYDAAALQRLVRLSYEIRRRKIAPSAVAAFMKLHPEWSTHPADGRPFVWNPATAEIAIQPVARQAADRRFSVQIWRESAG